MSEEFEKFQEHIQIKPEEPEIDPKKPWEGDAFERSELAEKLIRLIRASATPLVISVDGAWGSGKTFFLRRLEADLKNREFETIYFNAWEDDFHNDPLVALLGKIYENFNKTPFKTIVKQIKKNGVKLLKSAALEMLKAKTKLDLEKALKTVDEEILERYVEHQKTREALKESLKKLAEKSREKRHQPLVFMIDELDRCRPTFAIELLERVKHIFDIENIVFILGMDKAQLEKSIQSVYGDIASDIYLRKFFDFEFSIPEPDLERFFLALVKRYRLDFILRDLMNLLRHKESLDTHNYIVINHTPKFLAYFDLSLRDVDSIMRSLVVISKTCKENQSFFTNLVIPLLVIRLKNKELYKKIMQGGELPIAGYDYLSSQMKEPDPKYREDISGIFLNMEAYFYMLSPNLNEIFKHRQYVENNSDLVNLELFSKRIQEAQDPEEEIISILDTIRGLHSHSTGMPELKYVQKFINLA